MSKSDTFENDLLKLIYNATPIAGVADNAVSSPIVNIYVALHTADPGEAGVQTTNEAAYPGYARVAVARTGVGWVVAGNSVSPAADVVFPARTGAGTETITHFSTGTAISGAGKILHSGSGSPSVAVTLGIAPRVLAGTTITED